jgi:hypothetical protein
MVRKLLRVHKRSESPEKYERLTDFEFGINCGDIGNTQCSWAWQIAGACRHRPEFHHGSSNRSDRTINLLGADPT